MTTSGGDHGLFACPGEMARRCAGFDWSATPLGPVGGWSPALRTTTAMLLRTRFPMCLSWGADLVLLYNDAFIPTLGEGKHPSALGSRIEDVFPEVWDVVGYLQWSVLAGGESTFAEDLPLVLERGTGPEETFYTYSYSHVPDDGAPGSAADRGPGGVLSVLTNTTTTVVGARRMGLLNALASATNDVADLDLAVRASLAVLAEADGDLHHGACYLPGADDTLALAGVFGEGPRWPATVAPGDEGVVREVRDSGHAVVEVLPLVAGEAYARVALPLRTGESEIGVLVMAPHPLRPLDDEHERFLHLVADHVGQLLTLASARADEHNRLASLAAADKAKSTFLSNVSHEFRTPLTLILGPLEDALAGGVDTLDADELTAMHRSTHRLLRMVNGLLDVSRVDNDPRAAEREPTDIARLSEDLLRPFAAAAERAGLTLRTSLDPTIGTVEVDPRLWETILINLAANAIKYTLHGHVDVRVTGRDGVLELRVVDTGIGIAPEEQLRVFDRFHRVTGPVGRTIEGTGLGLALVADAVHAHGGDVTVASAPDAGSTFTVRLPLVHAASNGVAAPTDARAAAALADDVSPTNGQGPHPADARDTIVVVDDNPGMRQRLTRALADLGPVVACADGVEALEVLRRQPVDLVVTDVMMPRLDGIGLLREIRADDVLAHTPVVLLSARAGADAATEAMESGADDYVVKPFTRAELVARCRTTIELATLRASRSAEVARATMLAGISHDMQTPLSVVSAVLEMLADTSLDADQRLELVGRGTARAAQLEQLVAQFLDWSRLAAGVEITPRAEPVHLADLLERVAAQHDGTRLDASAAAPHVVVCDRARTERILHNLLDNAHRVARAVVRIAVEDTGDAVEVHVVDDGPGVDDRVLPRLFTAFGPTGRLSGSGLGLHVSRAAARAQGGDLVLAATDHAGSRFVLRLPAGS